MKKILRNSIENIPNTDVFDNIFLFQYLEEPTSKDIEVVYLRDLLEQHKNEEILKKVSQKPAMYSEVYNPKKELEIFTELFENAVSENKKVHVVGITLWEEVQMLEKYYEELGLMREDINAFDVDFSIPLVTVSCHIENLMWRGSDYKAQKDKIFFCPPIRESWQNKALFKWITRGVIAGIDIWNMNTHKEEFLWDCIREEKILPLFMGKVLMYNLEDIWFEGDIQKLHIKY